jgi:hypothetical protein
MSGKTELRCGSAEEQFVEVFSQRVISAGRNIVLVFARCTSKCGMVL